MKAWTEVGPWSKEPVYRPRHLSLPAAWPCKLISGPRLDARMREYCCILAFLSHRKFLRQSLPFRYAAGKYFGFRGTPQMQLAVWLNIKSGRACVYCVIKDPMRDALRCISLDG